MLFDVVYAAAGETGQTQTNPLMQFMPLILIFVVFWFLLIRPQQRKQKEHQEMVSNLKKGDKVITNGGMYGTVVGVADRAVLVDRGVHEGREIDVVLVENHQCLGRAFTPLMRLQISSHGLRLCNKLSRMYIVLTSVQYDNIIKDGVCKQNTMPTRGSARIAQGSSS